MTAKIKAAKIKLDGKMLLECIFHCTLNNNKITSRSFQIIFLLKPHAFVQYVNGVFMPFADRWKSSFFHI